MPLIYEQTWLQPYLVYEAPVDEKTKKIREEFKIDEETGYPEKYKWRNLAKLGKSYKPEDPFLKFVSKPEENYQKVVDMCLFATFTGGLIHYVTSYIMRRPIWAKPHHFLFITGGSLWAAFWFRQKSIERQAEKTAAIIDYARQHPERFGEIQRYKYREVLETWFPRR